MAARIQGHRDPWSKKLDEYSIPELDFVLEMAALDDPENWTFTRVGARDKHSVMAEWMAVLDGPILRRYRERAGVAMTAERGIRNIDKVIREGNARAAAWRQRRGRPAAGAGLTQGLTRGGKPVGE